MTNYNLGKIYKIERISDNMLIYVGSTCETTLCRRLDKHKQKAKKCPNRRVYKSISDNGGWENHKILLIKIYSCNSRDELHSEEARFIRALKPLSNIVIPMRTQKQYVQENSIKTKIYQDKYRQDNQEKLKECKRQDYLNNKAKYIERSNQRYVDKNAEILKRLSIVNHCCCGQDYTTGHKSRHLKSKQHINSIPVQFKLIEEMHNNRKIFIPQPLPTLI